MSTQIYLQPIPEVRGLYTSTDQAIANSTVFETLIGTGVGTLSVPANGFKVGDTFRATLGGHITCANNEDLTVKLVCSTGALVIEGPVNMSQATDQHWIFEVIFTIRQVGAAGVAAISSTGQFSYSKDASTSFEGFDFSQVENTIFDTTVPQTLDIVAAWNNAGNALVCETFVLTKIF